MKRLISIILLLVFSLTASAYAIDSKIIELRNKILEQSNQIKPLMNTSNDVVLLVSMFDSCLLVISQIDAYTYMLEIFNTIKNTQVDEKVFSYLGEWLLFMKRTSDLNIKSLDSVREPIEPNTKIQIARLRDYFNNLNKQIDGELSRFVRIRSLLKPNR